MTVRNYPECMNLLKNRIEGFILRHQIDLGRCLAVLLFSAAIESFYGFLFAACFLPIFLGGAESWLFLGITLLKGLFCAAEFWLGLALWHHRRAARVISLWLLGAALIFLLAIALIGPFLVPFQFDIASVKFYASSFLARLLVPLLLTPPLLWLWLALQVPAVRREFQGAQSPAP